MTESEIRKAIRTFVREESDDAGALLDNTKLDFYIDTALDVIVMDLIEFAPNIFTASETLTITANTRSTTPTTKWLQIIAAHKNVSDETPTPLEFVPWMNHDQFEYVGQTENEPLRYSTVGNVIHWIPTPAQTTNNYAKFWFIVKDEMTTTGPTYIPAAAHRLIPLKSVSLIASALKVKRIGNFEVLYKDHLARVRGVLGAQIQHQPRLLHRNLGTRSTRDLTEYDPFSEWFFR